MNDTVVAYGEALLDADDERIGEVTALGLDEVLMVRLGPYHRQHFSTQLVDVRAGQLLDIVPGRGSAEPMGWLANQGPGVPGPHRVRHPRPVRSLPAGVRGHGARRHPGRRSLPCDEVGQHQARRVPPAGPERDPRASGSEVRSPLPVPASAHQGEGAAGRQGTREAHGAAAGRRSQRRRRHLLGGEGGRPGVSTPMPMPTSPSSG